MRRGSKGIRGCTHRGLKSVDVSEGKSHPFDARVPKTRAVRRDNEGGTTLYGGEKDKKKQSTESDF